MEKTPEEIAAEKAAQQEAEKAAAKEAERIAGLEKVAQETEVLKAQTLTQQAEIETLKEQINATKKVESGSKEERQARADELGISLELFDIQLAQERKVLETERRQLEQDKKTLITEARLAHADAKAKFTADPLFPKRSVKYDEYIKMLPKEVLADPSKAEEIAEKAYAYAKATTPVGTVVPAKVKASVGAGFSPPSSEEIEEEEDEDTPPPITDPILAARNQSLGRDAAYYKAIPDVTSGIEMDDKTGKFRKKVT